MKRIFIYTGLIFWSIVFLWGLKWFYENYNIVLDYTFRVIGIFTVLATLVYFLLTWNKKTDIIQVFFIGQDLYAAITSFLRELPNPSKEAISLLITHLVYRFTRITIIGVFFAILPVWLLYQQNLLLKNQNILVEMQTKKMNQQTYLLNAERQATLRSMLISLSEDVINELEKDVEVKGIRDLSYGLVNRIISMSQQYQPYTFMEGDSLTRNELSQERGQLLILLMQNKLDSVTMNKILSGANFEYCDLNGANLNEVDLSNISLKGSRMTNALFYRVKFPSLYEVDFSGSYLQQANFEGGWITNCTFRDVEIDESNFRNCTIQNSMFDNFHTLFTADFSNSYLGNVTFSRPRSTIGAVLNLSNCRIGHIFFEDLSLDFIDLENSIILIDNWEEILQNDLHKKALLNKYYLDTSEKMPIASVEVDSVVFSNYGVGNYFQIKKKDSVK